MTDRLSPAGARRSNRMFLFTFLTVALSACSDGSPPGIGFEPQFAPGGGGGPPIKVTATDPPAGEQGTTLSVRVLGSNFEPGSVAEFTLQGVPGKVHTNSTTFVSDTELVADITIEGDSELGFYDVEVVTPHGKKGVGTELFEVQKPGSSDPTTTPLAVTLRDDAADGVTSGGSGDYVDSADGVSATLDRQFVFSTTGSSPLPPTPRTVCFDFGASSASWFGISGPICGTAIWNTSYHDNDPGGMDALAPGEMMTAFTRFIYRDPVTNDQVWVQFGDIDDPGLSSPNRAVVRRLDPDTWEIETTTQLARVMKEGDRVRGKVQRDTLGFVQLPFKATLRAQQ